MILSALVQIIAIIRGKVGLPPMARLEKLLKRQLFQQIIGQHDELLARIVVLDAELCSPGCGVSNEDLSQLSGYDGTEMQRRDAFGWMALYA